MGLLDRLPVALSSAAALRRAVRLLDQGNAKQAFPLLSRAARAGIAEAEYRVGRCYLEAVGVPPAGRKAHAGSSARPTMATSRRKRSLPPWQFMA